MTKRIFFSILTGALLALSFPPFGAGILAWVAFVPLMWAASGQGKARGSVFGFISGLVFFLGTVYWVVNSMYFYGGVGLLLSIPIMALLAAVLAVYFGLFGLFFSAAYGIGRITALLFIPCVWVSLEYMRAHLFTGFPWVLLGYSQVPYLPFIQIADITGVWGISFLIVAVNTAAFLFIDAVLKKGASKPYKEALIALALVSFAATYGLMRIKQVDSGVSMWGRVRIGIAQGNIDQSVKWDLSFQGVTVNIYRELSKRLSKDGAKLLIWPETAAPFFLGGEEANNGLIGGISKETDTYILTGSPSYNYNLTARKVDYFNSAFLFSPSGAIMGRYDKVHLVPFGEYVPMKRFLPFVKKLTAGAGDFSEGAGPLPIIFSGGGMGMLICYEAIFPEIAAAEVRNGATILVNITNDAWFGKTSAPYQHFGMSVLRAVENRTFLLRAANTGISAIIDPSGRVLNKTSIFEKAAFTGDVGLRQGGLTFYSSYGDVFAYGAMVLSGTFILMMFVKRR